MVTGLEISLLVLQIAPGVIDIFRKLIPKKGTSDFEYKLKIVKDILTQMKPLIEQGGGKSTTGTGQGPGVPEDLKHLIQKVEEGNQLVLKCEKIKKSKEKEQQLKLKEWIELFWNSLAIARFKVFLRVASVQLHFPEEKYKKQFQELINSPNMSSGSEPLSQGVEPVSTNETKDAKKLKQSVPSSDVKYKAETSTSKEVDHEVNIMHSEKPEDNTVTVRKVVFEVFARDDYGKKVVEKAGCEVKGVISAERVLQHNQDRDLVLVIGTKNFVEQDMIEYLEKKLHRKQQVYVIETSSIFG